jgi:hypothetical protein
MGRRARYLTESKASGKRAVGSREVYLVNSEGVPSPGTPLVGRKNIAGRLVDRAMLRHECGCF